MILSANSSRNVATMTGQKTLCRPSHKALLRIAKTADLSRGYPLVHWLSNQQCKDPEVTPWLYNAILGLYGGQVQIKTSILLSSCAPSPVKVYNQTGNHKCPLDFQTTPGKKQPLIFNGATTFCVKTTILDSHRCSSSGVLHL